MNAKEARELTIASGRNQPNYEQQREEVRSAIDDAARSGRCYVDLFFLRVANEAIIEQLREDGFKLNFIDGRLHEVHW